MNPPYPLKLPEALIGRDASKTAMLEVFRETCRGNTGTLLVPGHSGMGKTSLVEWLAEPVRTRNGLFVQGKFDQYHQNLPYYAVRKALVRLWDQIGTFNRMTREKIHDDIREALGDLGYLLVALIPDIRGLFPDSSEVKDTDIGFAEARHRFASVIRTFLKVVSLPEHPVVMFLDDWQWADAASLALIKGIHTDTSLKYFLLVASFRDEEVGIHHPLYTLLSELNREAAPPVVVRVGPLGRADVEDYVERALAAPVVEKNRFIDLVYTQTRGNPFHIRAFIAFLHEKEQLVFDTSAATWRWDAGNDLPVDIVDLFVRRLKRFSPESRELISLAACLGNQFDGPSLQAIGDCDSDDCRDLMGPFRDAGLVIPLDSSVASDNATCRFFHDRVQQAAFQLIGPERVPVIRLKIGRLLLSRLDSDAIGDRLFEILGHLNAGADLIHDSTEQMTMVRLNMAASEKARGATAFQAMLEFNRAAFDLAGKAAGGIKGFWETSYRDALTLCRDLAESEFIEGDKTRAESLIQDSLAYTRTAGERAESLNILIVHYTLQARYAEAISAGRQALDEFGIFLPDGDWEQYRDKEVLQIRQKLEGTGVAAIFDRPVMTDTDMLTVARLLITLGPPCYRTHQALWSVIVPKVVNLTLDHGLVPQIGYSYTALGGLLGWMEDDYDTARQFGELAERIMAADKFSSPSDQSVFYLMVGSSTRHWFHHLKSASRDYMRAYDIGVQTGNLQYAAYAFGHNMYCRFFQAVPLPELIRETEQSLIFSRSRLNQWAVDLCEGGIRVFEELSGESFGQLPDHDRADNDGMDSDREYLARVDGHKNIQVRCIFCILKSFYHLVMNDMSSARTWSDKAESLIFTVGTQGLLPWPEHVFIRFLILAEVLHPGGDRDGTDETERRRRLSELKRMLARMRVWADHSPENYGHKVNLAEAELAGIEGRYDIAARAYDKAVDAADKSGFFHWGAIAAERAFRFWEMLDVGSLAQVYRQEAYDRYHVWGAGRKQSAMKAEFESHLAVRFEAVAGKESGAAGVACSHGDRMAGRAADKKALLRYDSVSRQADELTFALKRLRRETAERKKAEARLRENERRYRQAQALGKVGNWEYNLTSGEVWGSDEARRLFGFAPDTKRLPLEAVTACIQDWNRVYRAITDILEKDNTHRFEYEIRPVSGAEKRIVRSTAAVITGEDGRPRKLAGVVQDITRRKEEEAERHQLELKLLQDQKIKAVGTLAGGIAHDFNNILYPVIGFTEMSIQDLPAAHPVQEHLEDILQGAKRAADLVKQIMSFSRSRGKTDRRPVALHEIINETLKLLRSSLPSHIEIRKTYPPDDVYVLANATEIHEVVMNLCTNAYHAMEDKGGVLNVELCHCPPHPELKLDRKQTYCCLMVCDTGGGIPAEIMDHVFEPYFTTKDQGKGAGLGLSVVHGIVKSCGGDVLVESTPGKGTVVSVYLPLTEAYENIDEDDSDTGERFGTGHILVVDDEPAIVKMLSGMLKRHGYRVTGSTSSMAALDIFTEDPYGVDLVITDMTMPGLPGTKLAGKMRDLRSDLPILICTGYSEQLNPQAAEELGVNGIVGKPISLPKLAARVNALLSDR
ncbi:MAG: AAA family ATPase [Desulfobacterales bacterium]|nr:AAA family ATPase [Desulfobacterales bacterium]